MIATDHLNTALNVGFGIIAVGMIAFAINVVTTKNVVHAALSLVMVMVGAAAQYLLLGAEFVAVTQVLVYVGAVMVLFLFGVMLTRAKLGRDGDLDNTHKLLGLPVAVLLLGVMTWVLVDEYGDQPLDSASGSSTIEEVSDSIFSPYLLPFWALSFLLLAAVIGAIVLARKD